MTDHTIRVLLIEDDPGDADIVREILSEFSDLKLDLVWAQTLREAIECFQKGGIHVILSDLSLPDSSGIKTFTQLQNAVEETPIVILSGLQDEDIAFEAIKRGAQDYLVKGRVDPGMLKRSLLCAIEREKIREQLISVTKDLRTANAQLEILTLHDPMTNLLNRRGLQDVLSKEVRKSQLAHGRLTVLIIDLDNFKEINDTLGYAVGDIVLKEVVHRFKTCMRVSDYAARVGGDEFMILLPQTAPSYGKRIAEKIRLAIGSAPIFLSSGKNLKITASFGVIEAPVNEAPSIDELLSQSYPVLHASKLNGKNRTTYLPERRVEVRDKNISMPNIVGALKQSDQFRVVAQPIYNLHDESAVGFEFLSRSRIKIFQMPDDFFRICLENNILTLVDHHCFRNCVVASASVKPAFTCHINIFPSSLIDIPMDNLLQAFPEKGGAGNCCIEISEQQILGDPSSLAEPVRLLKEAGCLVAIDDVGFGRSSLESLIGLEPHFIKVDKNLVSGAWRDPFRLQSLERLLKVAQSLGIEVVAEGVEGKEDLEMLRGLGVKYGQGFFWGRPVILPRLGSFLKPLSSENRGLSPERILV